ncbi:MAG: SsrA-binding protein SmpB [Gammaproteobacteria bacterium]|nr:SsrA-binding protein SmpB [Gammaproteobacteria bacterium]
MAEGQSTIALNKRARFEYHLEDRIEAGISLMGWEVKALRAGNINFSESHVLLRRGEAFLFGCNINPLTSASTHVETDPMRTRRLLLHKQELASLIGQVERKGYTLIPTAMYWKRGKVKVEIALAKGKKQHDKRKTEKDRDWEREKGRILRSK